ncbi:hypothetical protein LFYK43_18020 [Ligilactobacillus salitolerans]|uniref:Uncharacterized protein n=1 Tax=Ligilactobacillus salitolerans TaxID=1808352 RepID=A0A401IUW3_9LACO|nr:hypothetical protein [Ligilactobacillus salitolerans]GBG95343.1 hypothetical protein LFYK43_18020 [Ligilactobacillus salitolerans]
MKFEKNFLTLMLGLGLLLVFCSSFFQLPLRLWVIGIGLVLTIVTVILEVKARKKERTKRK